MAKYSIEDSTLSAIADSIRAKTGKTAAMTPEAMPAEIEGIEAGGGTCTVTFYSKTGQAPVSQSGKIAYINGDGNPVSGTWSLTTSSFTGSSFVVAKNSLIYFSGWSSSSTVSGNGELVIYNVGNTAVYVTGDTSLIYA